MTQQFIRRKIDLDTTSEMDSFSVNTDIDEVMCVDIETEPSFMQQCRIGYYIVKRLSTDCILDCGILYDAINDIEKDVLDQYSLNAVMHLKIFAKEMNNNAYADIINWYESHSMRVMTLKQFIEQRLYPCLLNGIALVNHNIPFDLGAMCSNFSPIGDDGFSFNFCSCCKGSCSVHPPIITKRLSGKKVSINVDTDRDNIGMILDTMTLGTALLGPGDGSLKGMGKRFRCEIQKSDTEEHHELLSPSYISYMINDVLATINLLEKEVDIFKQHMLEKPLSSMYSVASLGKGYYEKIGIPPFMEAHSNVPKWVYDCAMKSFYGARSEIKMRLTPVEIRYCDFKSQYTTANALLGLQELLLAEYVEVINCPKEAQMIIDDITVKKLQNPHLWKRLRVLVKIAPDDDILPTRWKKGDKTAYGVCFCKSPDNWYTLCDVIASKLLTGKTCKILQAVELVAHGKIETDAVNLFGDENFKIDLNKEDLFTRLIDMRSEVKVSMKDCEKRGSDDKYYYSSLEQALKVLASATSYGILVETKMHKDNYKGKDIEIEIAGKYFTSPIGTHIIGAARMMLAIAERLGKDRGLDYAMCDTDSMAFFRPKGMSRATFRKLVDEICEWFLPLSPYAKDAKGNVPELFELESVNDLTEYKDGKLTFINDFKAQLDKLGIDPNTVDDTLYILGVSCKRYCLYNKLSNGQYLMRKISAHATGRYQFDYDLKMPSDVLDTMNDIMEDIDTDSDNLYEEIEYVDEPEEITILDISGKWKKYQYIMWYRAIQLAESGKSPYIPIEEWSKNMVRYQESISTPSKLKSHKHIGIRPYSFLTETSAQNIPSKKAKSGYVKSKYRYYLPFAKSSQELEKGLVFRTDTGEIETNPKFEPLHLRFKNFFNNPETKAENASEVGLMKRSHVVVEEIIERNRTGKKIVDISNEEE